MGVLRDDGLEVAHSWVLSRSVKGTAMFMAEMRSMIEEDVHVSRLIEMIERL